MKATIRTINNGWMVSYPIYQQRCVGAYEIIMEEIGTNERAFTYDFRDEYDLAWGKVLDFITDKVKGQPPQEPR